MGPVPGEPRFCGGAVGYFGYDLIRHYERLPETTADDLELPDCFFILTRVVLIYDHIRHTLKIVALVPRNGDPSAAHSEALTIINGVKRRLTGTLAAEQAADSGFPAAAGSPGGLALSPPGRAPGATLIQA